MPAPEPHATALMLLGFGVMLAVSVAFSRTSARLGIPVALVFLLVGVLAGSEGVGRIPFDDYQFTFRLGTAALVLILFDGGLNTSAASIRSVAGPAGVLATVAVLATAGLVAAAANRAGFVWGKALLLGAIVSSTDAAAVLSVLRASGLQLKRRVEATLEVESGLNDPMAVILTTALTSDLVRPGALSIGAMAGAIVVEMAVGAAAGYALGRLSRWGIERLRLPAAGLYPAFTLGVACVAYGAPTLLHGSGFLAVYVAAVTLGSGTLPHRAGIRRVHDALGWLSQIVMFLLLGLLVSPTRLRAVAPVGLGLALFLAFAARPVVVALSLAPFGYAWREVLYVGWVGLRGAVPIVLATIPVMAGVRGAGELFDVVFFVVVVGAFVPGATVPWVTRRLRLQTGRPPAPETSIEVNAERALRSDLRAYHVDRSLAVVGAALSEIPFPAGAAVSVVEREGELTAPNGAMRLQVGDYVYIVARVEDLPDIELLFGRPERRE